MTSNGRVDMPNVSNQQKTKLALQKPHFLRAKGAPADASQSEHLNGYIE